MSLISDARDDVAYALDILTGVDVSPFPVTPEQLLRPRAVIAVSSVEPPSTACPWLSVKIDVWTVTPLTEPGPADAAVDQLCADTLAALERAGIPWTTADRGVWADTYPCYRIACEVRTG